MRRLKWFLYFTVFSFIITASGNRANAYTDYSKDQTYVYDSYGYPVRIPDAYEYKEGYSLKKITGMEVTSAADMFVKKDGEVFIVESEPGRIFCFSREFKLKYVLKNFVLPNGKAATLKNPSGVFVSEDNIIYIADTGNNRILRCDAGGNVSLQIEKPEIMLGTHLTSFLPVCLAVDSAGRISAVVKNINSGIMQFSADGSFIGYMGAPSVSMDAFTRLLRKFSTKEQKAKMQMYVPTEYNNIKIDSRNFIWGTISSLSAKDINSIITSKNLSGSVTPIKKLNTMGKDVLRRKGVYPPAGDLYYLDTPSKITDVGLGPNHIYSMLDSQKGRIFTYNNDGILLYAFGNMGTKKGETQNPAALDYIDDNLILLDSGLNQILVYKPTAYGSLLLDAQGYYEDGNYDMANQMWEKAAELNSNFVYAYMGLGNSKYNNGKFKEAMEYYEYADDPESYGKAKEKLRKEEMKYYFPVIFLAFVVIACLYPVIKLIKKIRRYVQGEEGNVRKGEED